MITSLVVSRILVALYTKQVNFHREYLGIRMRSVLSGMILKKALNKPILREVQYSTSAIVNLVSSDCSKFGNIGNRLVP